MIKVSARNAKIVAPLLEERITSCGLEGRISLDYAISLVTMGATTGAHETYVDDEKDPSCVLAIAIGTAQSLFSEKVCLVNLLHVSEKVQKENPALSLQLGRDMLQQVELRARAEKADVIRTASWVWRGKSSDIGSFYESSGFELQSKEYVKILNTN